MRLIPSLAGLLLISTAAIAQPYPGQGPAPDQPQPGMQAPPGPGMQTPQGEQGPPPGAPGQPPRMNWRVRFDTANVTHDGRLTRDQAQAAGMRAVAVHFDQIDADHKGYVTKQDIRAWHHARQQMHAHQIAPPATPPQ